MNVNEEKLTELLQNLVEGFNDCVCCPLTYECNRDEDIDPIMCAENLKSYLTN